MIINATFPIDFGVMGDDHGNDGYGQREGG
jgi:hypothetical protein